MSDHDEKMKSLGVMTNIVENVENSNFDLFLRLKVIQQLRDKYRAELQKLKQECCQLRLAKSASTDKVRESEENKIRLLNISETIKSGNIELENNLHLLEKEGELMDKRIANDSIKYDNQWNEIEKKLESLPHYREIKMKKNEIEQLKDSVINLELKAVTLPEENSKKKAQIWKTDRDYIIKLAEFMVARKKKYEETVARNKRISYNDSLIFKKPTDFWEAKFTQYKSETVDKNKLVMPVTPYKFQENVKKVPLKDCTEVDLKDTIDKITADFDSKKKRLLDIFEENNKSETAVSCDNIVKRKVYDEDKEINEESSPKKQECSKKQVIEIIEDVKVDKNGIESLLSGVNINDLKETNKITSEVQANTFSTDADKSGEGEEQIEELDMVLLPPTQYKDCSQDKNPKKVSFNIAADKPSEIEEEIEEVSTQSEMDLTIDSTTTELYKFYSLDAPKSIYFPNKKSSATNKFGCDEFEDYEMKDEENVAKEGANINEQSAGDSAVNKETVVIPEQDNQEENNGIDAQLSNMDLSSNTAAGEDLDLPNIDASLLLSPNADLESVMDEDNNESEVTSFLTRLRGKNAMSFLGSTSTQKSSSGDQKEEASFSFNFGGEDKKSKGGFFSMF